MPQLDQFTYFTQFFWLCLLFFTFYMGICNDRDGVLSISRILKLRKQLLSHREHGKTIPCKEPNKDLFIKGLSTGLSYMVASLVEVSQWCKDVDLVGFRKKRTFLSCFGEISGSRAMERYILYNISKSSPSSPESTGAWITCSNCRNSIMLIHLVHGQGNIRSSK